MSNSPTNKEQDQLMELTPTQQSPGAAKPTDFKIEDSGPGQCGDTKAEREALLAEADGLGKPIPERNVIPNRRISDE